MEIPNLNDTYDGVPLRLYLDKVNALGEYVWKLRNHTNLPAEFPDLEGLISIELKTRAVGPAFELEVWGHNMKVSFNSFQFDVDGIEGEFLVLPNGVDCVSASIGPDFPSDWFFNSQREDGHPREGLVGAFGMSTFKPTGSHLLATVVLTGSEYEMGNIVLRRVGIYWWNRRLDVLPKARVFPGS